MTDTFALEKLYNNVVTQFASDGTVVPNLFGWREKRKHIVSNGALQGAATAQPSTPGNRIIWVPGNEEGDGDAGKHSGPSKNPGTNPRSLATLGEVFTVYIQGSDPRTPANELAQYRAVRFLYDAWFRAVYLAAYGTFSIQTVKWDRSKTERQHGAMMIAVCTVEAMIPDVSFPTAPVNTAAALATTVLSQTDPTVTIHAVP